MALRVPPAPRPVQATVSHVLIAPSAAPGHTDAAAADAAAAATLASLDLPADGEVAHGGAEALPAHWPADAWVLTLVAGDLAWAGLLERLAATAAAEPLLDVIGFDTTFPEGERIAPVLAPGANPWLARCADVGFGRYAVRAGALRRGSGGTVHARLRALLASRPFAESRDRWAHLAQPWVQAAMTGDDVTAERARAVDRARADLRPAPVEGERVSVVICTHDRGRLVRQLVRTLDPADPRLAEVVVVANRTTSPPALETLDWVRARPGCRVLVYDEPFNFSRMSNAGAALTTGDRLLFLNDDVAPITEDWLEPLLAPLRDPDVGISGPLLLYPDERVQHAGIYLGFRGHSGHAMRHGRLPEQDYLFYGSVPREVSAVTGAVMMVRRDLFEALNGFDELLPTYLQDVDLCLRARASGLSTIWTPLAELLHMESTSIREIDDPPFQRQRTRERERFLERWGPLIARDPLHSPHFDVDDESLRTLA